jgi:DNA primase
VIFEQAVRRSTGGAVSPLSTDPEAVLSGAERRRLMEAHVAASRWFRGELLRATDGAAAEYLKDWGAGHVLSNESTWKIGYAPESSASLVDVLRLQGFDFRTLLRAGLAAESEDGHPRDQFRDHLMVLARDARLDPVGFVGIRPGLPPAYTTSPTTLIHRPSNVLVGLAEQMDLLGHGAIPVIVDDPVDAMAIEKVSRMSSDLWAGIPLCGGALSTAQARTLKRYAATNGVAVALSGDEGWQRSATGFLDDLSLFFRSVRAVELPAEHTPATLLLCDDGPERLRRALLNTRQLAVHAARQDLGIRAITPIRESDGPHL